MKNAVLCTLNNKRKILVTHFPKGLSWMNSVRADYEPEKPLDAVLSGREDFNEILRTFLYDAVLVCGEKIRNDSKIFIRCADATVKYELIRSDGKLCFPCYASDKLFHSVYPNQDDVIAIKGILIAKALPQGIGIAINPGSQNGVTLHYELIDEIKKMSTPNV